MDINDISVKLMLSALLISLISAVSFVVAKDFCSTIAMNIAGYTLLIAIVVLVVSAFVAIWST